MATAAVQQAFFDACEGLNVEEVVHLFEQHPDLDVNWKDEDTWTALHIASWKGRTATVEWLLSRPDINVSPKTSAGVAPIHYACQSETLSIVTALLRDPRVRLDEVTGWGNCPMLCASEYLDINVIKALIASGKPLAPLREQGFAYTVDYSETQEQKARAIMVLVNKYIENEDVVRHQVRLEIGYYEEAAADIFAMTVFACDELLTLVAE